MSNPVTSRYDFVYFFDITDGNPNGDPDAGNLPRLDAETGQGLVTDVCLKRKIRNFVGLTHGEKPPFEIYVKEKAILNQQHERAYVALKIDPKKRSSKGKDKAEEDRRLTRWMCDNFFDIRAFGAVMTTDVNCGQVRGPIQFGLARSIHPIVSSEHAVTRCAVTTPAEAEKQDGGNRTMGRKFTVPYGLYRVHGYVNAEPGGRDQRDGILRGGSGPPQARTRPDVRVRQVGRQGQHAARRLHRLPAREPAGQRPGRSALLPRAVPARAGRAAAAGRRERRPAKAAPLARSAITS